MRCIMGFDFEYSTKPDNNGNRYIIIFNPLHLYFRRGINISAHKPDGYYSRKRIDNFINLLIKAGYTEINEQ